MPLPRLLPQWVGLEKRQTLHDFRFDVGESNVVPSSPLREFV
jgi:hypothetical protein